jgi:hypothetical protein
LNEIFNQITTAELEEIRKRAIKFLVSKLPTLIESSATNTQFNKEFEDLVVKNVKQVLVDVDAEEFILFIKLLASLPSMSTLTGRQDLVNIIMAQCELDKPYDVNDVERLMVLMSCLQQALPLFSKNVQSTKYVYLYLDNVMSSFKKIQDDNVRFELLKAFAELCIHFNGSSPLVQQQITSNVNQSLDLLFDLLIEYLPMPVEIAQLETPEAAATQQNDDDKFNFSYVECLLYAFHIMVKFQPDFFNSNQEAKEKLRDFRLRLQYFAKGTQNYIKELRNSITANTKENEEVGIQFINQPFYLNKIRYFNFKPRIK